MYLRLILSKYRFFSRNIYQLIFVCNYLKISDSCIFTKHFFEYVKILTR